MEAPLDTCTNTPEQCYKHEGIENDGSSTHHRENAQGMVGAGREDGVGQERNGTQNLRVGMAICLEAVKI